MADNLLENEAIAFGNWGDSLSFINEPRATVSRQLTPIYEMGSRRPVQYIPGRPTDYYMGIDFGVSGTLPVATTITSDYTGGVSGYLIMTTDYAPGTGIFNGAAVDRNGNVYPPIAVSGSISVPMTFYGPPGIKVADPDSKCMGCFFGDDKSESHTPDCKWHNKFKPPEDGIQGVL